MKVSAAVKELKITLALRQGVGPSYELEAPALGIEALKRHQNRGYLTFNEMLQGLPGETPEERIGSPS
ncbi:hypothetical protein ES703_73101 [subsurface metagenome]